MWQQIEANKRKTFYILVLMTIFTVLFGLCLAIVISGDIVDIIIYNIIFYAIVIGIFIYNIKRPLSSFGDNVYKYNGEGDKTLLNVVSEMQIASGLPKMPEIYILDSSIMNAFACGTNPSNAKIVVSKGLLKALNRDELQGVIGHEIAHIVNRDTCYLLYASIIVNVVANISNIYFRGMTRGRRSSKTSQADLIIFFVAVIFMILAPILANMFYFFLSRKREYLADACSAQFTRYPEGLASALKKISGKIEECDKMANELNKISSPLASASYIVPLKAKSERDGLFSTHPSTKNRIKILLAMSGDSRADLSAYNHAYESVTNKKGLMKLTDKERKTISSRKACKEKIDFSHINANINAQALGIAGSSQVYDENQPIGEPIEGYNNIETEIKNHRNIEDMMWTLAHYTVIDCPCGTKLRLPESYLGQTITCPHCKTQHVVKE